MSASSVVPCVMGLKHKMMILISMCNGGLMSALKTPVDKRLSQFEESDVYTTASAPRFKLC